MKRHSIKKICVVILFLLSSYSITEADLFTCFSMTNCIGPLWCYGDSGQGYPEICIFRCVSGEDHSPWMACWHMLP